jgi:GNAT superfamily N-acetyltransferase
VNQTRIRRALATDLPELLAFEQGVVEAERPYNSKIKPGSVQYYDIAKLIAHKDSLVLVAENAGKLIATGHTTLKKSSDEFVHERQAYLGLMYVEPTHRGQGLIQQIIEELLAWARSQGITDFFLDVYAGNQPALQAYEKFGFRPYMIEMKLRD